MFSHSSKICTTIAVPYRVLCDAINSVLNKKQAEWEEENDEDFDE